MHYNLKPVSNFKAQKKLKKHFEIFKTLQFWLGVILAGGGMCILAAILTEPPWLSTVLSSIGTTLLTIFLVSVIYDTKNMSEYFEARITEVIVANDYLDKLSRDSLLSLRLRVNQTLARELASAVDDDFIRIMQNELDPFMTSCYITHQRILVDFIEEKDNFRKDVITTTSYINQTGRSCFVDYL